MKIKVNNIKASKLKKHAYFTNYSKKTMLRIVALLLI